MKMRYLTHLRRLGSTGCWPRGYVVYATSHQSSARRPKIAKVNSLPILKVREGLTLKELADAARRSPQVVLGILNEGRSPSQKIHLNSLFTDRKLIETFVKLMGYRPIFENVRLEQEIPDKDAKPRPPARPEQCVPRPPIVAVLGHVDHGKTTLLDALRASRMVDSEYGGITQHLAAFTVSLSAVAAQASLQTLSPNTFDSLSEHITFLDTPGHAAFSGIRARGAAVTDLIVLVVAADDGVMPQTVESIRFAKEANTPIIVAVNKIDKYGTNVEAVLQELAVHDVVVEKLGGNVQAVEISALRRLNLHLLLEAICVQSEMMQLKADPTGPCEGWILEANMEDGLGKVATCLITRGTLRGKPKSGPLVSGESLCSPRFLLNDLGQRVAQVEPGYVARVPGWKELPPVGSLLLELPTTTRAQEVIRYRISQRKRLETTGVGTHSATHHLMPDGTQSLMMMNHPVSITLLIKADTHGTLEAIKTLLQTCPVDQCTIEYTQCGIGPVTLSELENAKACSAVVLLFNLPTSPSSEEYATEQGIVLRSFNIIYRLAECVRDLINARLPPVVVEKVVGEAQILALFNVKESRGGGKPLRFSAAGCRCTKGHLVASSAGLKSIWQREELKDVLNTYYRVVRPTHPNNSDSKIEDSDTPVDLVRTGTILVDQAMCYSLKHERSAVESIRKNIECGLSLTMATKPDVSVSSNKEEVFFSDWQVGDLVQCYVLMNQVQSIEWDFDMRQTVSE